ncbi:MAG: VCBS repeat-containing protein [Bacteroidota bacterium]
MKNLLLHISFCLLVVSCSQKKKTAVLFELVPADRSGIHFQNAITENDSINVIDFQYCYNGGGVGIGDFNNDGLEDVFFGGNQVSSRLYLNRGALQFEEVTEKAKVITHKWVTGVAIIDINNDGFDDIYLNVGGANCNADCPNLLFVNQGIQGSEKIPTFKEMASDYGLNESEYAQQAVFFDYDLDGDLDAFIARNGNVRFDKNSPILKKFYPPHLTDILLENTQPEYLDHPYFVDVSERVGIHQKGFALGVGIADFNNDNRPDVYVGNDFITNDLLYLNTPTDSLIEFSEASSLYFKHHTYNSMGLDIADVNNDGFQDLLVVDMLPFTVERRKMMMGITNYDKYQLALNNGYSPQFVKNTLHINSGAAMGKPMAFQEVGFYSGIAATDWSWAPLFADFDGDGDNDLLVTNGYGKDVTDLDFINFSIQNNMFGTEQARNERIKSLLEDRPRVLMPNFLFENLNGLSFSDRTSTWLSQPESISNGAAFADFDNDGDLDVVVNNIDQNAFLLENKAHLNPDFNYLKIQLIGPDGNKKGIGTTIKVWSEGTMQTQYQSVIRGYLSSVTPKVYFGLNASRIDSIQVVWPNGKQYMTQSMPSNQTITIDYNGVIDSKSDPVNAIPPRFKEVKALLPFNHQENFSNDYVFQHLLQTQHSKLGPCMTSTKEGNLIFIGGSHGFPGQVFERQPNGTFTLVQKLEVAFEDSAAAFFDFDNDGDLDLYVASGGSEHLKNSELYQDRLYENDENRFRLSTSRIPDFRESTSCIVPLDYDKDGDRDLFIGSNLVPRAYPVSPQSILLQNEKGVFTISQEFKNIGMVNDAIWEDIDKDGWTDLIVFGDWIPITILKNQEGTLVEQEGSYYDTENRKLDTCGWWKSIVSGDLDNDGDTDFLLGNQGSNNFINPTQEHPVYLYHQDYDQNGSVDPLIGAFQTTKKGKKLMPLHSRDDITKQLVSLKNKYLSYETFGKVDYMTLLEISDLSAVTLYATLAQSCMLRNNGNFEFGVQPLPQTCQLAPITTMITDDFDQDGNLDALLAGNDFQAESQFGRYDALNGIFLKGDGTGNFKEVKPSESGFYVPGQASQLIKIKNKTGQTLVLAAQNNDSLKVFTVNNQL